MSQKNQTALQKMQDIANRLISNTPELSKMLDSDSVLKPKKPISPNSKKIKSGQLSGLNFKSDLSVNDYHQKCKELANELQVSKQKVIAVEEQISIIKQRFVEREIQYRKIIEQLHGELKSKSSLDSNDRSRMALIGQLHKQIIENIDSIQTKTSKILIEQESDIRRFFHKKISQIKEKFKEDKISKTEKDHEYLHKEKQMLAELDWIKNIAHKIDEENKTLVRKFSTLKAQFDIQEKDKTLLLKELLSKKKENAVLKSQVEQYEKLLSEISQEMQDTSSKKMEHYKHKPNLPASLFEEISENVQNKRFENTITHLNKVILKQKKRVRDLKNLYMREIGVKSQLEGIVRTLVDDVRESVVVLEKEKVRQKKAGDTFSLQAREKLLEKILANQKILTLLYDKMFYSATRTQNEDLPPALKRILQGEEEEGNKDEDNKEEGNKDEGNKDEDNKEEGNKEEGNKEEGNKDEGFF